MENILIRILCRSHGKPFFSLIQEFYELHEMHGVIDNLRKVDFQMSLDE